MQQALALALSLTATENEAGLNDWLLKTIGKYWNPQGILLALPDVSGRQLECSGYVQERTVTLTLEADDFGHPLAHVLQTDCLRIWDSLSGGARVENVAFLTFLQGTGTNNGLFALPVHDPKGKTLGVLGIFDAAPALRAWHKQGELGLLVQIFARQLTRVQALQHHLRRHGALKESWQQITDENHHRQQIALLESHLVGPSEVMRRLREQIIKVSGHDLSVLILGETGTGKDVAARMLHQCSSRAQRPFVAINCAAIPENLIESELFGYQKGAFSGAQGNKTGLIAQAHGGTLFLDEVGDMPVMMQVKLLRVLETHRYRPLGGDKEHHSDFRVIAATHQPLNECIAEGRFRQDLWHRLCQSQIVLPPLREHAEDIPALCHHFIAVFARRNNKHLSAPGRLLLSQLLQYNFPGNVRELRNLLEVACAHTTEGSEVSLLLPDDEIRERFIAGKATECDEFRHIHDLRKAVQDFEMEVIASRLRFFDGNRRMAAESLRIPRRTLDHKCQKLEVE
ncbi:TPA: sigma-54-dependent Fis family transcriptional regulator [Klebsiella oxytoca]|uniref:Sigma-54-dependent Fis family transcriptional regulator n=1 Tax=Klebsiella oxytoca TaxID=571 RepID=A0AAN5RER2_KLEOX|nr:sigma-54-dependent Fis family transcriptional regulator [Klebsiella oxytoca]